MNELPSYLKDIKRGWGKRHSALCPFHEEKTGSFTFEAKEGGNFHCFGCGVKGFFGPDWAPMFEANHMPLQLSQII